MIFLQNVRFISCKTNTFKTLKNEEIKYLQATIEDSDANRFIVSVAKDFKTNLVNFENDPKILIQGDCEISLNTYQKDGKVSLKMKLLSFQANQ